MSDELKPCPYCGSAPELHDYSLSAVVCCPTCGVSAKWAHGGGDHARRAVAAWNRRVPGVSVPVEVREAIMQLVTLARMTGRCLGDAATVLDWLDAQPTQGQPAVPEPDWTQAPEWAQWWAVSASGVATWFSREPVRMPSYWCHHDPRIAYLIGDYAGKIAIPLGIDWRTTLRQRPQGQE